MMTVHMVGTMSTCKQAKNFSLKQIAIYHEGYHFTWFLLYWKAYLFKNYGAFETWKEFILKPADNFISYKLLLLFIVFTGKALAQ